MSNEKEQREERQREERQREQERREQQRIDEEHRRQIRKDDDGTVPGTGDGGSELRLPHEDTPEDGSST